MHHSAPPRADRQPARPDPINCFAVMRLIRRSGLSYAAQALLTAILDRDRYGKSRDGCTASLETLAIDIGATSRYVAKLLLPLLDGGWIVADPQRGKMRPLRIGPACTPDHGTIGQRLPDAPMNDRTCTHERSDQEPCPIGQTKRFPRILEENVFPLPPEPEELTPEARRLFASCLPHD